MTAQTDTAPEENPAPNSDYLNQLISHPRMTALAAGRTGTRILTVQTLNKEGSKYRPRLWALPADADGTPYPLTAPESGASLLTITDDGTPYITLGKDLDEAEHQSLAGIYRLPAHGEPELVLTHPGGIDSLAVRTTAAGTRYVYTAKAHRGTFTEQAATLDERQKTATSGVLYTEFPTRFWDQDLGTGVTALFVKDGEDEPRRIDLPGEDLRAQLTGFSVCPSGKLAALTLESKVRGIHPRSSVWLLDLDGQTPAQLIAQASDTHDYSAAAFNPGGTGLLITEVRRWLPGQSIKINLNYYQLADGTTTELARDLDRWPDNPVWLTDTDLAFVADNLGATAIYTTSIGGTTRTLVDDGTTHFSNLHYNGGSIIALADAHQHSAYPVSIDPASGSITRLAAPVQELQAPGRLERLTSTASDGTALTSFLALPVEGSGPYPLVVFAHGGPWGSWNAWTYRWNPWVFTAAGYAVLLPEPAISTGYGQHMLDRGGDELGGTPYTDIMVMVEDTAARPDIQGDNVAFSGGSYGGFMTNWVAGRAGDRFKCYVTHASIWDFQTMYFATDNGIWHEWKWEFDGEGDAISPRHGAANIAAPMLVIHGDRDYRVPIGQAHQLWAELQRHSPDLGHAYLYYPDEGHWILKPGNSKLWYEVFTHWLSKHLLGQDADLPAILG